MLTFKSIKWKNLLSTGNAFTVIQLDKYKNALIVGENGAGKSTILDAICFALFSKPFRNINKPQLINSVNEKGLVAEVEFETNGKSYRIVRGLKPGIFEIYCDDTLLNQDSTTRDYQEYLEKFILKMNYKSFTQIVILGSASFTPFMQLKPADRRAVIEDLLDIQIFSVMNVIVKQKLVTAKESLSRNQIASSGKEEKKNLLERTIVGLKFNQEQKRRDLEASIANFRSMIFEEHTFIAEKTKKKDELLAQSVDLTTLRDKYKKMIALQSKIEVKYNTLKLDLDFYSNNDDCPTCRQSIDSKFKAEAVTDISTKSEDLHKGLADISVKIDETLKDIGLREKIAKSINDLDMEISAAKSKVTTYTLSIADLENTLENLDTSDKMLWQNEKELEDVINEIANLNTERQELLEERRYIETAVALLKDGGIKTKIIKQYLPIINKLINKYLSQMGFFVNFNINEQFEETIKSRYRDEFSYQNFSEGEKTRIDLALLFTWRAIAKMRNSVNTNLLILDEVLDGSLDNNGTDEFLKIMWDLLGDTNTFVISHKTDTMLDKFQKVLRFSKKKNFSELDA